MQSQQDKTARIYVLCSGLYKTSTYATELHTGVPTSLDDFMTRGSNLVGRQVPAVSKSRTLHEHAFDGPLNFCFALPLEP